MAIFNVSDFKVVFGWVCTLLLCVAVYLYQTDQQVMKLRDASMEALIKENHKSIQTSLAKKDKESKEDIKDRKSVV